MKLSLHIAQLFKSTRAIRKPLLAAALVLAFLSWAPTPAHATDKTLIQLQAQVQDLQDALARMQQTNDERWALTKNALDQHTDAMTRLATTLATIQQQLAAVQESEKSDQLSSQVQAVHDSVDEVKVRLARLEKQLNDIAAAQQTLQAQPAATTSNGGAAATGAAAAPGASPTASSDASPSGAPSGAVPSAPQPDATQAAAAYVPPVRSLYQSAYRDYTGAHYDLAQQEFTQIVQAYPQDDLAANAQYYLGEIAYHLKKFGDAAKDYDLVLQNYPGSSKSAAAQLRKGSALIQLGERAEGIRELREVMKRYPQSPENAQARAMLNGMGVPTSLKPNAARDE